MRGCARARWGVGGGNVFEAPMTAQGRLMPFFDEHGPSSDYVDHLKGSDPRNYDRMGTDMSTYEVVTLVYGREMRLAT